MFGKMVDVPLADQFVKRNGIGVLRLPYGREESENLYRNYFTQVLLTGAEPLQDSFVLRRSQAVF